MLEARGLMRDARCFCVVLEVFLKIPLDGFSQLIIYDHFPRNDGAPSPQKQHHSCLQRACKNSSVNVKLKKFSNLKKKKSFFAHTMTLNYFLLYTIISLLLRHRSASEGLT